MAESPICIITSTGMKCSASAVKVHRPAGKACVTLRVPKSVPLADAKLKVRDAAVEVLGHGKKARRMAHLIARVAELIIAAGVDGSQHFTIVKGR